MAVPSPFDVAMRHQDARTRLTDAATNRGLLYWRSIDPQELDAGWDRIAPQLVAAVTQYQVDAARQAAPYLGAVAPSAPAAELVPEAFAGVTLDGREIGPAMFGAVTTTKQLTGAYGASRAFEVGASFLATVIGSAMQDMGRSADGVLAVGRNFTRYVRVLSPGACSRCAVLAGKSSYRVPFARHPRCRCTAWPVTSSGPGSRSPAGMFDTPEDYFLSLSRAEQERIFTKAGAEAIRNGADVNKVVNARRGSIKNPVTGRLQRVTIGIRADGTPLQVYATVEGTTARGEFGRRQLQLKQDGIKSGRYTRTQTVRLMPEQIAVMAGDDPVRWRELLVRYGYLV